jgi:hypothetical protein
MISDDAMTFVGASRADCRTSILDWVRGLQSGAAIMGTRHLIAMQVDGEYPIAQYGQWDGYPDGQGLTVLRFLRNDLRRDDLIAKAKAAPSMTQEMRSEELRKLGHDGSDWVNDDVAAAFYAQYPQLSRDVGGKILAMVQDGDMGAPLRREITFAGESLMCEWAYVIDFDKNTFEVFKGFNKKPLLPGERFFDQPIDAQSFNNGSGPYQYYQVRKAAEWSLGCLPDEDAFLAALSKDDDSEAA